MHSDNNSCHTMGRLSFIQTWPDEEIIAEFFPLNDFRTD